MKHYIKVCVRALVTGKIILLFVYLRLLMRSFLAHRDGREGLIRENIKGRAITAFHYPQLINLFEEIFIWSVYSFDLRSTTPMIIDCGSNIGLSVIYFKDRYPASNMIAFEPDGESFKLLQENIANCNFSGVELHQVALSSTESTVNLYSRPGNSGSLTMSLFKSDDKTEEHSAITRRLSAYIDSEIDLLKIDVEGAEVLILQDLIDTAKIRLIQQMVIEYHPTITRQPVESFIAILESHDFFCTKEKDTIHPGATEVMIRAIRKNPR